MRTEQTTPLIDRLGELALAWRTAGYRGETLATATALADYRALATTLIDCGVTLDDLDIMDTLPDELMPAPWQEANYPDLALPEEVLDRLRRVGLVPTAQPDAVVVPSAASDHE